MELINSSEVYRKSFNGYFLFDEIMDQFIFTRTISFFRAVPCVFKFLSRIDKISFTNDQRFQKNKSNFVIDCHIDDAKKDENDQRKSCKFTRE